MRHHSFSDEGNNLVVSSKYHSLIYTSAYICPVSRLYGLINFPKNICLPNNFHSNTRSYQKIIWNKICIVGIVSGIKPNKVVFYMKNGVYIYMFNNLKWMLFKSSILNQKGKAMDLCQCSPWSSWRDLMNEIFSSIFFIFSAFFKAKKKDLLNVNWILFKGYFYFRFDGKCFSKV